MKNENRIFDFHGYLNRRVFFRQEERFGVLSSRYPDSIHPSFRYREIRGTSDIGSKVPSHRLLNTANGVLVRGLVRGQLD